MYEQLYLPMHLFFHCLYQCTQCSACIQQLTRSQEPWAVGCTLEWILVLYLSSRLVWSRVRLYVLKL